VCVWMNSLTAMYPRVKFLTCGRALIASSMPPSRSCTSEHLQTSTSRAHTTQTHPPTHTHTHTHPETHSYMRKNNSGAHTDTPMYTASCIHLDIDIRAHTLATPLFTVCAQEQNCLLLQALPQNAKTFQTYSMVGDRNASQYVTP
jgi:hypothetical protein